MKKSLFLVLLIIALLFLFFGLCYAAGILGVWQGIPHLYGKLLVVACLVALILLFIAPTEKPPTNPTPPVNYLPGKDRRSR